MGDGEASGQSGRSPATLPLHNGGRPEAKPLYPVRRCDPAAVCRPAYLAVTGPAAAPVDPVGAPRRPGRVGHRHGTVIAVPVLTPLPDVAVHVVQPQTV